MTVDPVLPPDQHCPAHQPQLVLAAQVEHDVYSEQGSKVRHPSGKTGVAAVGVVAVFVV